MAVSTNSPEARIDVPADATEARLVVPAGFDRARLTADYCFDLLKSASVEITDDLTGRVYDVVNTAREQNDDEPIDVLLARAQPAVHGKDGWVEWQIKRAAPPVPEGEEGDISHYERSAFTLVEAQQELGQVHDPVPGQDGRDVTGQAIAAQEGKPADLQRDGSIQQTATGKLVAQNAGVLIRQGNQAAIHKSLEIEEDVDFSTGNIDFDGDVVIKGEVRDRFRVRSTGSVYVKGLIEAATIDARGDLDASGGFAGRERGNAHIGGNMTGRYLDNIYGTINGDLTVEREIINCELTVHGNVNAERGAIIGGQVNATGSVYVALLGSRAGTPTELIVGRVPRLEPMAHSLNKRIRQIDVRQTTLEKQKNQLTQTAAGSSDAQRRLAQVNEELHTLHRTREKAANALKQLRAAIEDQRTVDVTVDKRVSPGVILVVGHQRFRLNDELRGPVHIRRNRTGQIIYQRTGGEPTPLAMLADLDS